MDTDAEFRIDKTAFSVVSLEEADDELSYWLTKTPQERLRAVELIRQTLYGYTPLPPDFKEFLRLLNEKTVEYLLIGGYAVGYYGYVRATADMDVWLALNMENAAKAVTALREFGFNVPELSEALFLKPDTVIRMGVPPFRIEILTSISGVEFAECYAERTIADIDDIKVPLISLDHLKANKKASGRKKDIVDLEHLP